MRMEIWIDESIDVFITCFAGLLDVARRTYTELVDDVAGTYCQFIFTPTMCFITQQVTVDAEVYYTPISYTSNAWYLCGCVYMWV